MKLRIVIYLICILLFENLSNAQTGLEFDGIDDYVYISYESSYTPDSSLTIETWIKQDTVQYWPAYISYFKEGTDTLWSGYWLGGNDMGQISLFVGSDTSISTGYWLTSSSHIIDGSWHHLAGVIEQDSAKLYIDGILEASLHIPNAYYSPSGLWLGTDQFGYVFDGVLDEVRIWNRAKSQEEINNLKDSCLTGSELNLVAYFPMEDSSGSSIVTDYSNLQNNGTQFYMDPDSSWVTGYNCIPAPIATWNCVNNICLDPGNGSGIYTSLTDCESVCGTVGIYSEVDFENEIELFPNPCKDWIHINLKNNKCEEISIINNTGKVVMKLYNPCNLKSLDLSELPSGIYFLKIQTNKTSLNKLLSKI